MLRMLARAAIVAVLVGLLIGACSPEIVQGSIGPAPTAPGGDTALAQAQQPAYSPEAIAYIQCVKDLVPLQLFLVQPTTGHASAYIEDAASSRECRPHLIHFRIAFSQRCPQCDSEKLEDQLRYLGQAMVILDYIADGSK